MRQRGREQGAHADDLRPVLPDRGDEGLRAHARPQVDDREAGALQEHADEVLADVVQVALDGADDDGAHAGLLAGGHVRAQQVEAGLHDAGGQQHLGDEALALAHALPDHLHAGQQRLVEDLAGAGAGGEQRLGQGEGDGLVAGDDGLLELVVHATPFSRSAASMMRRTCTATSGSMGRG